MGSSSQPLPTLGAPNATEDSKVRALLSELQGIINGNIDAGNVGANTLTEAVLAAALKTRLGLGTNGRGKSVIATSETRIALTYGTLTTPDKVTITLPTDGIMAISYRALMTKDAGNAYGAIFLGANQLMINGSGAPTPQEFGVPGPVSTGLITTDAQGLRAMSNTGGATTLTTTGTVLGTAVSGGGGGAQITPGGGVCFVEAAAGTYDVTVQYKVTAGTVTVSDRSLRVWTDGF